MNKPALLRTYNRDRDGERPKGSDNPERHRRGKRKGYATWEKASVLSTKSLGERVKKKALGNPTKKGPEDRGTNDIGGISGLIGYEEDVCKGVRARMHTVSPLTREQETIGGVAFTTNEKGVVKRMRGPFVSSTGL